MAHQFQKHYTRAEARALLPDIRDWLKRLGELRADLIKQEQTMIKKMSGGADLGGPAVNIWVRRMAEVKQVLLEFYRREIQIKDIDRGLIDFPALVGGREVFLCWEQDEEDIEFWHDLDSGYAGRERLPDSD